MLEQVVGLADYSDQRCGSGFRTPVATEDFRSTGCDTGKCPSACRAVLEVECLPAAAVDESEDLAYRCRDVVWDPIPPERFVR